MEFKSLMIDELSDRDKGYFFNAFYNLSKRNLQTITKEYLDHRFKKYKIIGFFFNKENNEIMAFSFFTYYTASYKFLKIPIFHYGLTVVDESIRGQAVLTSLSKSIYHFLKDRKIINPISVWVLGLLFTSKCSTPVSFLKIRKTNFSFNWPKIKNEQSLSYLSGTSLSMKLSRFLSQTISTQTTGDYIIRDVNNSNDYALKKEAYKFSSKKDKMTVGFFKNHIQPCNELITISWCHPIFLKMQKGKVLHGCS